MSDDEFEGISRSWELVLSFFLGGATSSIAQDFSDYLFFRASSQGPLSANAQVFYWYWVPFLIYIAFFFTGFVLAKTGLLGPVAILELFLAMVLASTILSLGLPQWSDPVFQSSLIIATVVSVGIILGVKREVD